MDPKQRKQKHKTSKFLSNVSFVHFQSHQQPFSPARDHRKLADRGFSGPVVSMIPEEARRPKGRHDQTEPTSPKISCIGQIKHKDKMKKKKKVKEEEGVSNAVSGKEAVSREKKVKSGKRGAYTIMRIFKRSSSDVTDATSGERRKPASARDQPPPSLGELQRFASGRGTLRNFDWKIHGNLEDNGLDSDSDEETIIPFSAPMSIGGDGTTVNWKRREEINIWKRRTISPPTPLSLR